MASAMRQRQTSRPLMIGVLAALGFLVFLHSLVQEWAFASSPRDSARGLIAAPSVTARSFLSRRAVAEVVDRRPGWWRSVGEGNSAYPELSRVEDIIYDSCVINPGTMELECLQAWDRLKIFHESSALECSLDDLRCVILDALERLCKDIDGAKGLALLQKVSRAVLSLREKFDGWESAFNSIKADTRSGIQLQELARAMDSVGVQMTDAEVKAVFAAADANNDGEISKDEFSNFLTAGIFAEQGIKPADDTTPKPVNMEDFLQWSTSGRGGSWSGLAAVVR